MFLQKRIVGRRVKACPYPSPVIQYLNDDYTRIAYGSEILNSQVLFSPQPWQTWRIISQ